MRQPVEMLRFGECPVHERRDVLVSVKNISMAPVPYKFPKTANFAARPERGLLQPMQEVSTVITFRPVQLGKFKKRVNLVVEGGTEVTKVPVWCQGSASTVSANNTLGSLTLSTQQGSLYSQFENFKVLGYSCIHHKEFEVVQETVLDSNSH